MNTKRQQISKPAAFFSSKPADGVFKQNRISSVSERLFSFSLLYLIRKAEHDFYATLPSLWISFHEILHSGLSDVWASCVALLLCCLTPYLWPFSPRPGRWSREVMLSFFLLLNYNGRPITCHHKHAVLCAYGAILE